MSRCECNHEFFLPIDAGVLVDWGSGSGREPNIVRAVWSPVPSQGEARVRVYSINHAWRAQPLTLILSPCARGEARKAVAFNTNFPSSIGWFRTDMPRKFAKNF